MTNKKVGKYCRIFSWIEDNDIDLADPIKALCMEGALAPYKGINGITFLMPGKDSSIKKNIHSKAYSSSGNDANDSVTLIKSLIIPDIFKTTDDFAKKVSGNKLQVKFNVKKINNNEVIFEYKDKSNDIRTFKIKPLETGFNTLDGKSNLAIWKLIEGEPPIEGELYKVVKSYKEGGMDPRQSLCKTHTEKLTTSYRAKIADDIELTFINKIRTFTMYTNNPYLITVLNILKYLQSEHRVVFVKIKPLLDIDPIITFYILLEPYKTDGEYLISSDVLNPYILDKILSIGNYTDAVKEYKAILNHTIDNEDAKIFTNTTEVIESIFKVKNKLLYNSDDRLIRVSVLHTYDIFERENRIADISNVLPKALYSHYMANKYKRMWQDEYRFIVGECIKNMNNEPNLIEKINMFNVICNNIKLHLPGNDYANELSVMNEKDYTLTVCIRNRIKIIQYFVNSSDFLFCLNNVDACESTTNNRNDQALAHLSKYHIVQKEGIDKNVAKKVLEYLNTGKSIEDFRKAVAEEDKISQI